MDFPSAEPVRLRDRLDVAQFVAYLRSDARTRPVAVLTVDHNQAAPYVSIDTVAAAAKGKADVVIMPTDELTRSFASSVGEEASVYRGACRVYPPGQRWETAPHSTPLRLTRDRAEIAALPQLLLDDLKREIAYAATPPPPPPLRPTSPTVRPAGAHGRAVGERDREVTPATPGLAGTATATSSHPAAPMSTTSPPPAAPHAAPPMATPAPASAPAATALQIPPMIADPADSSVLAHHLYDPGRQRPVVVVSRTTGLPEATADVEKLRESLAGLADVCEITTPGASWAFSRLVPPMCQVYGGAGRVYPIGQAWAEDPYVSPLRFAYGLQERDQLTRQLISDTMRMASRGSYATSLAPATRHPVTGSVIGVAGGRGLVKLDSGDMGVLWPELIEPDLDAERLFAPGMKVAGDLDPQSHRIDIQGMRQDAAAAITAYQPGDTILVRVKAVRTDACTLELFPGLEIGVAANEVTDDPSPDLRGLMSPGETLPVLLVEHDADTGEWLLSPAEADDAARARPAPSVLRGGPPWLVPSEPAPVPTAAAPGAATAPGGLVGLEGEPEVVRELRLENEQLTRLLKTERERASNLDNQLTMARTQRRESQRRSRTDREANERTRAEADRHLFLDEAEQLTFEIRLAWARLIPPADKAARPLKAWTYGDHFFQTLAATQGVSRDKVVEVIVHVLTGRDAELTSRELHQLRTGYGGDDPPRTRNGGETCWRVSLQVNTPSARRLHYWQCTDGSIELSSIRQHDDFES